MVSIGQSLSELDRCHEERATLAECYRAAIHNVAHYAIELEGQTTARYRQYLEALALEVAEAEPAGLRENSANLRALLRDYRDKAAEYLNHLREDLTATATALQQIVDTLAQADGDADTRVRGSLSRLREIASSPAAAPVRALLTGVAAHIEASIEELRKQHQVTVSQFLVEIRMLHKRINTLETAAALDDLTKLFSRAEIEQRLLAIPPGDAHLILMAVTGLRRAESRFSSEVCAELTGAFAKRLRNSVPLEAVIGRWSVEEFVVILAVPEEESRKIARYIAEHLSGTYVCLHGGKTVLPGLQVKTSMVPALEGGSPQLVQRVSAFLKG